jgi:hypothetical protein
MTFSVLSNAKRHFKGHGVLEQREECSAPYTVGFDTPLVSPEQNQLEMKPVKLKWVGVSHPSPSPLVTAPFVSRSDAKFSGGDGYVDTPLCGRGVPPLRMVRSTPALSTAPPSLSQGLGTDHEGIDDIYES